MYVCIYYLCQMFPRFGLILMATSVQVTCHCRYSHRYLTRVFSEDLLQVISPQPPRLHQCIVQLNRCRKRFVSFFGPAQLSQQQSLESVELGSHVFSKILEVCGLDHIETFLEFGFSIGPGHLQVTLDLLPYLLEAIYYRHARYCVYSLERI